MDTQWARKFSKKYNNNEKKKMAEPVKVLNKKELNLKKIFLYFVQLILISRNPVHCDT